MSYLTEFMAGRVLSATRLPKPIPVDFAIPGRDAVLVAVAGWWTQPWSLDGGILVLRGELRPDQFGLALGDDAHFLVPEAEDALAVFNAREAARLNTSAYLREVEALRQVCPEWDAGLAEWAAACASLPSYLPVPPQGPVDQRTVGLVPFTDASGVTDLLVLDENGIYAVARGNEWLESIGAQWADFTEETRPSLVEFLGWIADQSPYGGGALGKPLVSLEEGTTEGIALRSVPSMF